MGHRERAPCCWGVPVGEEDLGGMGQSGSSLLGKPCGEGKLTNHPTPNPLLKFKCFVHFPPKCLGWLIGNLYIQSLPSIPHTADVHTYSTQGLLGNAWMANLLIQQTQSTRLLKITTVQSCSDVSYSSSSSTASPPPSPSPGSATQPSPAAPSTSYSSPPPMPPPSPPTQALATAVAKQLTYTFAMDYAQVRERGHSRGGWVEGTNAVSASSSSRRRRGSDRALRPGFISSPSFTFW